MSSLILLRHGQASFGADRYDALSDLGREQALATGAYWAQAGARFDTVWIGPRDRHRDTARLALAPLGMKADEPAEPGLDEFAEGQQVLASAERSQGAVLHGPDAVQGKERARLYAREIDAWAEGEVEIAGVRSAARFRADVEEWLARATASARADQQVLAVSSGGVISAVLCSVLGLPNTRMAEFMRVVKNASITELAFTPGRKPGLVSFNLAGHLDARLQTRI